MGAAIEPPTNETLLIPSLDKQDNPVPVYILLSNQSTTYSVYFSNICVM